LLGIGTSSGHSQILLRRDRRGRRARIAQQSGNHHDGAVRAKTVLGKMEPENHKIRKGFISRDEADSILKWVEGLSHDDGNPNLHLAELSKELKGKSLMFDISKNEITRYIANFQSISKVSEDPLPEFILSIIGRISEEMNLPMENIFMQAVDMNKGGKINPHYDASLSGYINYKCNISVLSEDYEFYVDRESSTIEERDLYCFEASLFKHWTNEFDSRRVFLSIGFAVPYSSVGRNEDDPRVRLSKRIEKHFQQFNI
jgi:hypothetical protein